MRRRRSGSEIPLAESKRTDGPSRTNPESGACQSRDQAQERGLARPRRPEEDGDLGIKTQVDVERQAVVNAPAEANFQQAGGRTQRGRPGTGSVRCTSQSAVIEISEIDAVNQPARTVSPA